MHVLTADALGFCFGVRDALAVALNTTTPETVTIHGELVHNESVKLQLHTLGFAQTDEQQRNRIADTPRIMITAHGISDRERRRLEAAGKALIDTTCPLVRKVHLAAQSLAAEGRHVVIIGRPGHVEVRGIQEDLPDSDVVVTPEQVRTYPYDRLGVVCQSTTSPQLAESVVAALRAANPHADLRFLNTICQPTRDRQEALLRLLPQVDAMVVVGGRNSNNTQALAALCATHQVRACHVQTADDLQPEWFRGCRIVGLTAGTSTLDSTIDEVRTALEQLHPPA